MFCFQHLEDTVSRCFVYQDLGHTQTPRICYIFVLSPASIQEHSPPKCLFFIAKAKLPNRPGFALIQGKNTAHKHPSGTRKPRAMRPANRCYEDTLAVGDKFGESLGGSQAPPLKTLTSLNKEVRPSFLCDTGIWSFPSVSSLSDYSIWRA